MASRADRETSDIDEFVQRVERPEHGNHGEFEQYCADPYYIGCNYQRLTVKLYEIGLSLDYGMQIVMVESAIDAVKQIELAN